MSKQILTFNEFLPDRIFPLSVVTFTHTDFDELHSHEFSELVVVTDGNAIHRVKDQQYEIKRGDVFIIPQGIEHCYSNVRKLTLINIIYDAKTLPIPALDMRAFVFFEALFHNSSQASYKDLQVLLHLDTDKIEQTISLTTVIADQRDSWVPGSQFCSIAAFMLLIGKLSQWYHIRHNSKAPIYTIGKILNYINNNYKREIKIAELAHLGGMSRRTFFRRFTDSLGMTPGHYLQQVRILQATELLRKTSASISEIAINAGFCDSNYFSKQFRKVMSISPKGYRESLSMTGKKISES